jgi:hypothetical protein
MSQDFSSRRLRNLALFAFLVFIYFMLCSLFLLDRNAFSAQVTLSWTAPTTNTDGTQLKDLAGYKVYYGTASRTYSTAIDVGKVTNCQINNLTDGLTYYFAVTAYDTSKNESAYSNEVSKTFTTSGQQFTLTITKSGTGTGTVSDAASAINCGNVCSASYKSGTVVTLTATATMGSAFAGWGGGCTGTGQCAITINANTTVTAAFNPANTYTIKASAGRGGSISPTGSVTVNNGASKTFTITPNTGYRISYVTVDGSSVGAVSSYTFSNVTAAHTINASFRRRLN